MVKELLNNARLGWNHYNYNGKFTVLLFLVLLYFFFRKEKDDAGCTDGKKQSAPKGHSAGKQSLIVYTVFMACCCVFPITAALLMCYQTRFYDYQWIMNYVPLTIVIAFGATIFLEDCWKRKTRMTCITLLLVLLVAVCGRMGQSVMNPQTEEAIFDGKTERQQRQNARVILAELAADAGSDVSGDKLCLWAPQEIMASVRALQPEIYPVYGRDMWDASLGAYTYDTYTEEEKALYQWMSYAEIYGTLEAFSPEGKVIDGVGCVKNAVAAGVNRILLPATMQTDALQALETALEVSVQKLGEYYLFVL